MTEYDYRFKGLKEFVEARDPKRIAVNYRENLGTWATASSITTNDGISLTDYLLLKGELGDNYAKRLVSSEYVMMDYQITPVPSEIELLKKMRQDELERVKKAFAEVVPGGTKSSRGRSNCLSPDEHRTVTKGQECRLGKQCGPGR